MRVSLHFLVFSISTDLISLDGSIRVTSDEFTISLLSPDSEAYRRKAQKYSRMVKKTTPTTLTAADNKQEEKILNDSVSMFLFNDIVVVILNGLISDL